MAYSLETARQAFDTTALSVLTELDSEAFHWTGVNAESVSAPGKILVITALKPGQVTSAELGPEGLSIRDGIYIVTLSLPKGEAVGKAYAAASAIESAFRRKRIVCGDYAAWCDDPYTENVGNEPMSFTESGGARGGRYLISTTIPWSIYC